MTYLNGVGLNEVKTEIAEPEILSSSSPVILNIPLPVDQMHMDSDNSDDLLNCTAILGNERDIFEEEDGQKIRIKALSSLLEPGFE
jgi:hypothetical protein